jgi:hypothetical protein
MRFIWLIVFILAITGSGWWFQPSEKYISLLGRLFLIYGKKKKCSKPPTRDVMIVFMGL